MKKFGNLVHRTLDAVEKRTELLDKIVAGLLAFCPLLQHYVGPVYNMALTVVVLLVPYLMMQVYIRRRDLALKNLTFVLVLIVYFVYRVIDHGTSVTELGQSGVLIIYLVAAALGLINIRFLCKTAITVACLASLALVVQYICFYLFRFHVQMIPTGLLLSSSSQWVAGAQTGLVGITGKVNDFYRPAAFFLEPSHIYIYAFPQLFLLLFGGRKGKPLVAAVIISLGLVLSTSGMGMVATAAAWCLYFALYNEKQDVFSVKNIIRKRNLIIMGVWLTVLIVAVIMVPTVRRTVMRIFTTGTGVSAISGRVTRALRGLKGMTPRQWIIGVEDTTHGISYNMPGLVAALYRHGLIGMVLSVELYAKSVWKLKLPFCVIALVIIITSFFSAHTHSTIGYLYYSLILILGFQTCRRKPIFRKSE